jgi:hypothetical protein
MSNFTVHPPAAPAFPVEAATWMLALAEALQRLALVDAHADCVVEADGDICVRVGGHVAFVLRESGAVPVVSGRLGDVPRELSYSPDDGPSPMDAPAWKTYADEGERALAALERRLASLPSTPDRQGALEGALDLLLTFIPAQSGAVLLVQPDTRDLRFVCARGPRSRSVLGIVVPSGRGIAGLTVRAGIALTVREADADPRHYAEVDAHSGYRTHAILSVPIRGERAAMGCVQLLNPFAGTAFVPWHQAALLH